MESSSVFFCLFVFSIILYRNRLVLASGPMWNDHLPESTIQKKDTGRKMRMIAESVTSKEIGKQRRICQCYRQEDMEVRTTAESVARRRSE